MKNLPEITSQERLLDAQDKYGILRDGKCNDNPDEYKAEFLSRVTAISGKVFNIYCYLFSILNTAYKK